MSFINNKSTQINGNTISIITPVGTDINNLTATVTTPSGLATESLVASSPSINESSATTTYIVTTSSGITNGYTVTITIPQTLFSCIADNNESPAPPSPCACLIQNDGSDLVWYVESMPLINDLIPGIFTTANIYSHPVVSANYYLTNTFNPESHCGYNDWRIPTSESYGSYPNSAASNYNSYYLWDIESSDTTNIGRLGYFAANNPKSSFNIS